MMLRSRWCWRGFGVGSTYACTDGTDKIRPNRSVVAWGPDRRGLRNLWELPMILRGLLDDAPRELAAVRATSF